jgi:4-amino-4-deoxy-L-arabinose transferase-like glycosyltransferase/protein-S-isoprenylcysteine O-methyltransferase Ste14
MTRAENNRSVAALNRLRALFFLPLFPFAVYAFVQSGWMAVSFGDVGEEVWDLFCLGLALAGLSIRALEAGFHAGETRQRSLPDVAMLRSSGIYSVVRYPLYLANALILIAVALLFKSFLFVALVLVALTLYYRKLILARDSSLLASHGAAARLWISEIPAFFPRFSRWAGSSEEFSWMKVVRREAGSLALVGLVFFTMEALEGTIIEEHALEFWIAHEPHWLGLLLLGAAFFAWQTIQSRLSPVAAVGPAGSADIGALQGYGVSWKNAEGRTRQILDGLSATHVRSIAALVIACLVFFLPGFSSFPVTSRDESRFAQPAKQMVESGDYVDIRLQEAARYRKPIGMYWLQAGTVKAAEAIGIENARNRIEIYRIPSLLAAIGSVLLTYWIALAFVSRRYALLAGVGLASSTLLGIEARIATIDASMLFASTAAFGSLAYVYFNRGEKEASSVRSWGLAGIFWSAIAVSLLLKGPIVATILGLSVTALIVRERSARWLLRLRPFPGVLWILLLVLPWYLAIYLQTEGAFFARSVNRDLMSRLLQPAEGHWGPPGYFWLLFWGSFWPAAIFAPHASAFAWLKRTDPKIFFLAAWIVPAWVMFELVVTKLPHYVLPLFPGIAILIAYVLERGADVRLAARLVGILWPAVAVAVLAAACILAIRFDGRLDAIFLLAAPLAVSLALLAAWCLGRGDTDTAFALALLSAVGTSTALYSALPQVKGLAVARELVVASKSAPCVLPQLAAAGYREPNLVFYGGTDTALVSPQGAADFLLSTDCRVAFVERRAQREFSERAATINLPTRKIAEVNGFDYSNWRQVSFDVLVSARNAW